MGQTIPQQAIDRFLDVLSRGGTVKEAYRAAPMGRTTAYRLREQDDEFRKAWDDALEEGTDELEQVAILRAKDPEDRASGALLQFLLKGRRRHVYGDRLDVKHGGEVLIRPALLADVAEKDPALEDKLEDLAARLAARQVGEIEG